MHLLLTKENAYLKYSRNHVNSIASISFFTGLDLRALQSWAIAVPRVGDRYELRHGARLFQSRVKQLGLIENYPHVFAAVDKQYWRIILVYIRDRIRATHLFLDSRDLASEKTRLG